MNLPDAIARAMSHLERLDWRVGNIWLNPYDVEELRKFECFSSTSYAGSLPGFVGYCFGARVFETSVLSEGRVRLTPCITSEATFSLDYERLPPPPVPPVIGPTVWELLGE